MRLLAAFGVIFWLLPGISRAQVSDPLQACNSKAASQVEVNKCAEDEFRRADEEMNQAYRNLLTRAAKNLVAVKKIQAAQKAWLAFREAQLDAVFPAVDKAAAYGPMQPMCGSMLRAEMARERAKVLEAMVNPEEGDVCGGQRY